MTNELRYDFPVKSFGENKLGAGAKWEETIHQANGEGDEPGEPVGTVTIENEDTTPPNKCTATFEFGDGDTCTYGGKIPKEDGLWKGKEKLKLQKKSGKKFKDEIEVDSWNPKRWG